MFSSPSTAVLSNRQSVTQKTHTQMERERERHSESAVYLFCGSHDNCVYCWECGEGVVVWRTPLDSEVYATPSPCKLPLTNTPTAQFSMKTPTSDELDTFPAVCVSSSSGVVYLLDIYTGRTLGSLGLPGQIFSSPAVVDNFILVGCRDNRLYCIEFVVR